MLSSNGSKNKCIEYQVPCQILWPYTNTIFGFFKGQSVSRAKYIQIIKLLWMINKMKKDQRELRKTLYFFHDMLKIHTPLYFTSTGSPTHCNFWASCLTSFHFTGKTGTAQIRITSLIVWTHMIKLSKTTGLSSYLRPKVSIFI